MRHQNVHALRTMCVQNMFSLDMAFDAVNHVRAHDETNVGNVSIFL